MLLQGTDEAMQWCFLQQQGVAGNRARFRDVMGTPWWRSSGSSSRFSTSYSASREVRQLELVARRQLPPRRDPQRVEFERRLIADVGAEHQPVSAPALPGSNRL